MAKLRVGWFTFTCSGDNTIVLVELLNDHYFEWKTLVEFVHCKVLKSKNELRGLDVAFIEGAIANDYEEEKLREIRKLAKKLVAVGACACTGMPAGHRNLFDAKKKKEISSFLKLYNQREKVQPIKDFVQVDDEVAGCPMVEAQFLTVLEKYLREFGIKQ